MIGDEEAPAELVEEVEDDILVEVTDKVGKLEGVVGSISVDDDLDDGVLLLDDLILDRLLEDVDLELRLVDDLEEINEVKVEL